MSVRLTVCHVSLWASGVFKILFKFREKDPHNVHNHDCNFEAEK